MAVQYQSARRSDHGEAYEVLEDPQAVGIDVRVGQHGVVVEPESQSQHYNNFSSHTAMDTYVLALSSRVRTWAWLSLPTVGQYT